MQGACPKKEVSAPGWIGNLKLRSNTSTYVNVHDSSRKIKEVFGKSAEMRVLPRKDTPLHADVEKTPKVELIPISQRCQEKVSIRIASPSSLDEAVTSLVRKSFCGVFVSLFIMMSLVALQYGGLVEMQYELARQEAVLQDLHHQETEADIFINQLSSMQRIEKEAKRLGMVYPENLNLLQVHASKENAYKENLASRIERIELTQ